MSRDAWSESETKTRGSSPPAEIVCIVCGDAQKFFLQPGALPCRCRSSVVSRGCSMRRGLGK